MALRKAIKIFFGSEKAAGIVLIACTLFSLTLANTSFANSYQNLWDVNFSGHSLSHWINDGLMAIFFLLVGLELEREVYIGELSSFKKALLPIVAAIGGMMIPAGIHFLLNYNTPTQAGAGIPMATDIAFALAVLSLLGNRVPISLKILLTALAVIDDLGAIIVIALFYTGTITWLYLLIAFGIFMVMIILNRLAIQNLLPYLVGGVALWYCMLHSGVHATLAGVLTAFAIPFGSGSPSSISYRLQHFLHNPVTFIVLPLFALANTAVTIPDQWIHSLTEINSLGIFMGLFMGKPIGIFLFSYIAVAVGITTLPVGVRWAHILGIGLLGGIGFTMSIFITLLAFNDHDIVISSKIAILITSLLAGLSGYLLLMNVGDKGQLKA